MARKEKVAKHHAGFDLPLSIIDKIQELVDTGKYRNRTHVIEAGVIFLYEREIELAGTIPTVPERSG